MQTNHSLQDALAAANIPAPPPNARPVAGGFTRYGKNNRYWFGQRDGVALFGDWTTGESGQWFEDNGKPLDATTLAERKAKAAQLRKEQEAEQSRLYEETARQCLQLWNAMAEVGDSPYLEPKQVGAFGIDFENDAVFLPLAR